MEQSPIEETNVLEIRLCKKHGKPLRKGQRNCHECNRVANRKYQANLRRSAKAFQDIAARIRSI